MNSDSRYVETQAADSDGDGQNADVDDSQEGLLGILEILAPIHMEPKNGGESKAKPTAEKRANETQQIIENGNRLSNNPRHDPHANTNSNPRSDREEATAVHLIGSTEKSHVDVFACNVTQHDTGKNSLC